MNLDVNMNTQKSQSKPSLTKAEHYKWTKPGEKGKRVNVEVANLKIDHRYQREEISDKNTLAIARDFNWESFGAIVVMERSDGSLYIVDGQQRWLAVKRRGDITHVPAMLFQSDGPAHEARAFKALNERRMPVSAVAKFSAAVMAGHQLECEINTFLRGIGLEVGASGHDVKVLSFPAVFVSLWQRNPIVSQSAIKCQIAIAMTDEPVRAHIHKGLFYLILNGVDIEKHIDLIKRHGGMVAMTQEMRKLRIELNMPESVRLCGVAIMRLVNRYLRANKIKLRDKD